MPSVIEKTALTCLLIAGILTITACGESNPQSNFDTQMAAHPAGWLPADHAAAADGNADSCKSCHGEDLAGGISKVSCTTCHLGGPLAVHPATVNGISWFQAGSSSQGHGIYVVENGTAACKNIWCHGASLEGVAQSGPACSTCHPGEAF